MIKSAIDMLKKIAYILDRKQKKQIGILVVAILINTVFETLGVSTIFPLIEVVTDPKVIEERPIYGTIMTMLHIKTLRGFVICICLFMVAVYIIKNCYILWMNSYLYRFTYYNQSALAGRLMDCYLHQEYSFHLEHNVAELQRNINDTGSFFSAVQYIIQLVTEVFVCIALVMYLSLTDIRTTIIIAILMGILLAIFLKIYKKKMKNLGMRSRETTYVKGKWTLQAFNGIKEIKTMNREDFFLKKYSDASDENADVTHRQVTLSNAPKPIVEMLSISSMLVYMTIRMAMGEDMGAFVPVLSVFAMAAFRMLPSFNRISGDLSSIMFNKPSVDAVYKDILEVEQLQQKKVNIQKKDEEKISLTKKLTLEHIEYAYPTKPEVQVLKDICLEIPTKKSAALIGASGAGKTTIADIILGLYQPQEGKVLADGEDIYHALIEWHRIIGYIPQAIYLIDDTIRANVAFGIPSEEIDDDRVWEVLEEAQLAEYVKAQRDGIYANIGDRGIKISGGQRQRIGIARALYTNPELLILDEATSALDGETENAVMDAIYHLSGKVTMLVIAHRLTTIQKCDIIYRIEDGRAKQITYEEALDG